MSKRKSFTLLCLLMSFIAGCQVTVVNSKKLESMSVRSRQSGQSTSHSGYANNSYKNNWNENSQIEVTTKHHDPYRIKYHSSYSTNRWMAVEGTIGNEKRYPVVLDTGASVSLFVNDIHIRENQLAFIPMKSHKNDPSGWGKCFIPKLNIGQVTLANWPSYYKEQHMELRLLGMPLVKGKAVIVGLGTLCKFKYVIFDSIKEEVELSLENTYEPTNHDMWTKYPFEIEEGLGDNTFLYVKIPVSGEEIELQLDTGSGKGLSVSEELWNQINQRILHTKLKKAQDLYPYIGLLSCKRGIIPELKLGDRTIKKASISIFPDNSPIVERCSGLIGMQYFKDTIIVLDFERNLLWIQNNHKQASYI